MNDIKENEYQAELHFIETLLIMMLRDKRSWAGYMDVAHALQNIRFRYAQLREEYYESDVKGEE